MTPREHWEAAWRELGRPAPEALHDELVARHAEPGRAYHTLRHLRECFERLDEAIALAERPAEVRLALWFHDAVHDPRAKDNEERSAELARVSLRRAGIAQEAVERVRRLVLATRHDLPPGGADESLVVDVDLSILGAPPRRFAEYERQVRREYRWVPIAEYRDARLRILRAILERPAIYATAHFRRTLEERARANLARSVRRLAAREPPARKTVPVDESALAPFNSYGLPPFVARGVYVDVPFRCAACGREEVWRAAQQKWWYEVAKGSVESTAKLCRPCRRKEQARRAEARRTHLEGLERKRRARDAD